MKIDLHVHTSEISPCGHLTCQEVVSLYSQTDYDAIVIANHFNSYVWKALKNKGCTDYRKTFFDTIRLAEKLGQEQGLLVLAGCELRFDDSSNDYLVYGLTDDHCGDLEKLFAMTPVEFGEFARENDILFYQAHPFRNGMKVVDPACLFGMEVLNTHPRHDSRNDIALAWAEKFGLHKIAGSDCHQKQDVGSSAILTDHPVKNVSDLIYVLKNDLYTLEVCKK